MLLGRILIMRIVLFISKVTAAGAVSKPEVLDKGVAVLESNGNKLVVRVVVISAVKPTCTWACGGIKIRKGGRYATSVVKEGDHYVMLLEIDQVLDFTKSTFSKRTFPINI
jgi:hypothetical protein